MHVAIVRFNFVASADLTAMKIGDVNSAGYLSDNPSIPDSDYITHRSMRKSISPKFLQLFNGEYTVLLAMEHHMAVRTYRHQIPHRIYNTFLADFADRLDMMHLDLAGKFLTKHNAKVNPAHFAC